MPAKSFLKSEQKETLQKALKESEHPEIRERILIFLLLNDGKTQAEIANFLGCSLRKVAYWCVHGDPENLESLQDERMQGNYRKATDERDRENNKGKLKKKKEVKILKRLNLSKEK